MGPRIRGARAGMAAEYLAVANHEWTCMGINDKGENPYGPWVRFRLQHSTILTARPPREVSLYLVFISAPVSFIVLITESSET
jgi:hypothetical protein